MGLIKGDTRSLDYSSYEELFSVLQTLDLITQESIPEAKPFLTDAIPLGLDPPPPQPPDTTI